MSGPNRAGDEGEGRATPRSRPKQAAGWLPACLRVFRTGESFHPPKACQGRLPGGGRSREEVDHESAPAPQQQTGAECQVRCRHHSRTALQFFNYLLTTTAPSLRPGRLPGTMTRIQDSERAYKSPNRPTILHMTRIRCSHQQADSN